ncbi:MAG: hypothetical protein EBE86_015115 [Hormoscilla sp. GUM202]|nr:hypothetical protein [Hormoscilla sp. GUM202]
MGPPERPGERLRQQVRSRLWLFDFAHRKLWRKNPTMSGLLCGLMWSRSYRMCVLS